jgi:hypothetical protein
LKDVGNSLEAGAGLLVDIVMRGLIGGSFFGQAQNRRGSVKSPAIETLRLWFDFHSKEGMQLKNA